MFASARSGTVLGIEGAEVVVEAHRAKGLPGLALIGLARGAVKESLIRVRSAISSCDLKLPSQRLVVNLRPAELPKEASSLDLALALALLAAGGDIPKRALEGRRFFGELSLGGDLVPSKGAILVAELSRRHDDMELIVPLANLAEASLLMGNRVLAASSLSEVLAHLKGRSELRRGEEVDFSNASAASASASSKASASTCLSHIQGQARAKRALEIAAAGPHNILLVGPPGAGKTMLSRALVGILPALSPDETLEVTRIQSASGIPIDQLVRDPPFRAPHHTASEAALCGGGNPPKAGEVSLAHRGVLFLDELPEFSRRTLETLRQPLESGTIHIARAGHAVEFPARVLLAAAMNPCPCGFHGSSSPRPCLCSIQSIQRYQSRISGPLLDRIDLKVWVNPLKRLHDGAFGEPSPAVRDRVVRARAYLETSTCNDDLSSYCRERPQVRETVNRYLAQGYSARALTRSLRVAHTIAALEGRDRASTKDLAEALGFREANARKPGEGLHDLNRGRDHHPDSSRVARADGLVEQEVCER